MTSEALAGRGRATTDFDILATDVDQRFVVPAEDTEEAAPAEPWRTAGGRARSPRRRIPEWLPLAAAIVGWPLWWALGLTHLVFILAAIPLAWTLKQREEPLRLPPGFMIWMLFLVLVVVSGLAMDVEATGTVRSTGIGRFIAYGVRFANYASVTVVLLYLCNSSERVLPRRRVIGWFGWLAVVTVCFGVVALVFPEVKWSSPINRLLPSSVGELAPIRFAQVQSVLGDPTARPAAPFIYTNSWGHATALLLVWLIVAWGVLGSRRRRLALGLLLVVAMVPIVYSLNRGMWIGLVLGLALVSVRLAICGRTAMITASVAIVGISAVVFMLSPLQTIVEERIDAGHSNEVRGWLAATAIDTARQSPVIGFGSTRNTIGSDSSIAIGPTPECPRCGGRTVGSTGQFTLLLVAQGFLGLLLYCGYLVRSMWAFRRDHSPLGIAATMVIGMELFFGFFYTGLTMPLAIAFCAIGLLWRNRLVRAEARTR